MYRKSNVCTCFAHENIKKKTTLKSRTPISKLKTFQTAYEFIDYFLVPTNFKTIPPDLSKHE